MVSKSTYVAVFVAVMMATVTASAVVVSTHEYGIVLDYKGNGSVEWGEEAEKLNSFCEEYFTYEVKWSARSNGLLCVCSDEFTIGFLYGVIATLMNKPSLPDGMTIDELAEKINDPANNYRHWNIYDKLK